MKKELGKRALAFVLSIMLMMTMTPAKLVLAYDAGSDDEPEKVALTVDQTAPENATITNVTVTVGENTPITADNDGTYQVTKNAKITVEAQITLNENYEVTVKSDYTAWTVTKTENKITFVKKNGITEAATLKLADALSVTQKQADSTAVKVEITGDGTVQYGSTDVTNESSISLSSDTKFTVSPKVGSYVSAVSIGGQALDFAAGKLLDNGAFTFDYTYEAGKETDSIQVTFTEAAKNALTDMSLFDVDASSYYKADDTYYIKTDLKMAMTDQTLQNVAEGTTADAYVFNPEVTLAEDFTGYIYTCNKNATAFDQVITAYTLNIKKDTDAPEVKEDETTSWDADAKIWINGTDDENITVSGLVSDDASGLKDGKIKYAFAETEPTWISNDEAIKTADVTDDKFAFSLAKSQATNVSNLKCFIYVEDNVGNTKTYSKSLAKDTQGPDLQIRIGENKSFWNKFIFWKDPTATITIVAEDVSAETEQVSGINEKTFLVYVGTEKQEVDGNKVTLTKNSNSKYTMTLKDVPLPDEGTYVATSVYDNAGNVAATANDRYKINKDTKNPDVKVNVKADEGSSPDVTKKSDTEYYYKEQTGFQVALDLEDAGGLQSYSVTTAEGASLTGDTQKTYVTPDASFDESMIQNVDKTPSIQVSVNEDGNWNGKITVLVKDLAGNETTETLSFVKDEVAPVIDNGSSAITKADGTPATATGGVYYIDAKNQMVTVKTKVTDTDSGIAQITLQNQDDQGTVIDSTAYVADQTDNSKASYDGEWVTFKIKLKEKNHFIIVAKDKQGNETTAPLYQDNNTVVYDSDAPALSIRKPVDQATKTTYLKDSQSENPYFYYQTKEDLEQTEFVFSAEDSHQLQSLIVSVGDEEKSASVADINAEEKTITISGATIDTWLTEGSGTVTITAIDLSGNASVKNIHFVKDSEGASISNVQANGTGLGESSGKVTYANYFHAGTVTVTADITDALSGVRDITYTITDIKGNKQTGHGASLSVAAPFKGTITFTVYDMVNNQKNYQTNGFVVTNGNTSSAVLTPAGTETVDASGNPLYGNDTTVDLSVENVYAGIDSIRYTVIAPYDVEQNREMTIMPNTDGWATSYDASGMVTKMTGSIPVTNNSNDIAVSVTVRDKAGVEQTYSRNVSVDKTAPSISLTYDNNNVDSGNRYRADRTATIVVRERNFNANDFKISISNSNGSVPTLSAWTDLPDTENPDNSAHVATLTFATDGDYIMDMSYADMTAHTGNAVETQSFTVDKTAPAISVAFDNNSASNDHYFAQSRTAMITVNEHYFDASRVTVSGTATNDGAAIAFPGISGWTDNGDIHTATINFTADGDYQFTVNAQDQAGNAAPEYAVAEFVVDQTAPTITFGGVEDQASYNDVVEPTVTFEDVNYDSNNVNITLVGANQGQVNYGSGAGDSNNGQTITYSDFEHTAEVDDIYTLTATITDMAGNNFEDSITFSVNRFGSNYELDDTLKEIQGKYIKEPIDVVFTETNVNTLTDGSSKIVVSTNGTPKTLTAGSDYQVANAGGGGSWSRYTYTIPKDVFDADGTYIVSVYSEDTAGNVNENDAEGKDAEITFGVDGTASVISMTNLEENGNYNATSYDATVNVSDNLVLDDVSIELNGEKVEAKASNDNYTFSIPESTDKQTVTVVATDAAGNSLTQEVSGIVVTTNAFVRFLNNTRALVGTIVGVVAVGGFTAFIVINGGIGSLRFRPKKEKKNK